MLPFALTFPEKLFYKNLIQYIMDIYLKRV